MLTAAATDHLIVSILFIPNNLVLSLAPQAFGGLFGRMCAPYEMSL